MNTLRGKQRPLAGGTAADAVAVAVAVAATVAIAIAGAGALHTCCHLSS